MFKDLPTELSLHIFSFLNRQSLGCVAQVSKYSNELSEEKRSQEYLNLNGIESQNCSRIYKKELARFYRKVFSLPGNIYQHLLQQKLIGSINIEEPLLNFSANGTDGTNVFLKGARVCLIDGWQLCGPQIKFLDNSCFQLRNSGRASAQNTGLCYHYWKDLDRFSFEEWYTRGHASREDNAANLKQDLSR